MTVDRTESGRILGPGPLPVERGRTAEQRVALWVGALLVLACLLSVDLVFRFSRGTSGELAAGLVPVAFLGLGWLLFLGGLARLSRHAHERSRARGPGLVLGLVFFLVCAPAAASFVATSESQQVTYTCECGSKGRARGTRNCWGHWLTQSVAVVRQTTSSASCRHSEQAPWQDAIPN